MTDKIILYGLDKSPPVRAVLLTLKALNIDYEYVSVNPLKGEQKTEDYLKKNPSHTIPLLEVNGRHIADSHAIIAFLASKYGKDDKLYPKDLYQRAVVDQRLHYENGGIFSNVIRKHLRPLGMNQYTQEDAEAAIKDIIDVYDVLEAYLSENKYIAGEHLTIADLSILSSVSALDIVVPFNAEKWPKFYAWFAELKKLPYYEEVTAKGLKEIEDALKPAMEKYRK